MWELKPEYRHYNPPVEEGGDGDADDDDDEDLWGTRTAS